MFRLPLPTGDQNHDHDPDETIHAASFTLRHAAELLDHAAEMIEAGEPITRPEVVEQADDTLSAVGSSVNMLMETLDAGDLQPGEETGICPTTLHGQPGEETGVR